MDVDEVHVTVVDARPQLAACLEGHAVADTIHFGQRRIELRPRRGPRPDIELERFFFHALSQRQRHALRIARGCETAAGHIHVRLKECRRLLCRRDLVLQCLAAHAILNICHKIPSSPRQAVYVIFIILTYLSVKRTISAYIHARIARKKNAVKHDGGM